MGKKKRNKHQKLTEGNTQTLILNKKPAPMDPDLITAFARGRKAGFDDGYQEGLAKAFILQNSWLQEIDKHVKGIGPKTKLEIEKYFLESLKAAVKQKQIDNVEIL